MVAKIYLTDANINKVGKYIGTKDKSIIRQFTHLFTPAERHDFAMLLCYYTDIYNIDADLLCRALINVKINQKINNRPTTMYSKENINNIRDGFAREKNIDIDDTQ
jgi:hypothetical protein